MSGTSGIGPVSRRGFLKAIGAASLAAGCSPLPEAQQIVPYLSPQDGVIPGKPLFYRSTCRACGAGCGLTARTIEGRVVKLEGNPEDPIGRGALCARGQASLQRLYAPDRLRGPMRRGPAAGGAGPTAAPGFADIGWNDAIGSAAQAISEARAKGPDRIRMLTRPEAGSAGEVQREFLESLGAGAGARLVVDPSDPAAIRAAGSLLFGIDELPVFDLAKARTIVSFGADFTETWLSPVELARGFASGRGKVGPERTRLVWVGPRLSATGAIADQWLRARPGTEAIAAAGLLAWLLDPAHGFVSPAGDEARAAAISLVGTTTAASAEQECGLAPGSIAKLASELATRSPSALLGPGVASAGPDGTRLAAVLLVANHILGNTGKTVQYGIATSSDPPSPFGAMISFLEDARAGKVDVLLVHHADPAGALPAAFGAADALAHVPFILSFSDRLDATTRAAHLILPDHHPLESFGVSTPRRGIVSIAQATMNPLWSTRAASQTLMDIAAKIPAPMSFQSYRGMVDDRIAKLLPGLTGDPLDAAKRAAIQRGGIYDGLTPPAPVTLRPVPPKLTAPAPHDATDGAPFALVPFATSLRAGGVDEGDWWWLREIPDPMTTISWSTWIEVSPATAARLGITDGDVVEIATPAGKAELPAYVYPAIRDDAIGIPLGSPEPLALLPPEIDDVSGGLAWLSTRATITLTGRHARLPRLEGNPMQRGSEIIRSVSAASPRIERPAPAHGMYAPPAHPKHRWAMAIDLDRCTGCDACIVACYAENNLPVNGPALDARGRNMEWLRIERYFGFGADAANRDDDGRANARAGSKEIEAGGNPADLRVDFLPMLCQQCTSAPCEPVCPVYATYHTSEGLNVQVYNRCVGTRYCSNNCPYKVRTFNWRDPLFPAPLNMQLNPLVTVRSKGVMEKCTFCSQRIRVAEIAAEAEGRPLRDGEFTTACAETCPAEAIVFGDADDPESRVSVLAREERAYNVLEELNTRPAISYLARVREESGG